MKAFAALSAIFSIVMFLNFSGCNSSTYISGRIVIILTDSPLNDANVTGVYITVTGLQYHTQEGWKSMEGFGEPKLYNLFDLRDGNFTVLGDFALPAGRYTQIRFMLDAPVEGSTPSGTPGCFIRYDDDSNKTIFVPSGGQTGYKADGNFSVPSNGSVTITADFDARKSIVEAASSGKYLLKPTIRLVVNDEAGNITGTVGNMADNTDITYVLYAYEEGSWNIDEANEPPEGSVRFPNAIASTAVKSDGNYTLAFLAAGTYDLIVASYDEGVYVTYYIKNGTDSVDIAEGKTTTADWML